MTTGQGFGELWSPGARDWARFAEPHFQPLYEAIHDRLGIRNGTRLLDVGCGPGGAALLAAGRGARVAGLDASPGSVEVARERVPDGDFRIGDMESLPWSNGSFDAVTGFNSFPFAGNPAAALAEARRVLVPGGKVGIAIFSPREESQQPKIMAAIAALAPPQSPGGRVPLPSLLPVGWRLWCGRRVCKRWIAASFRSCRSFRLPRPHAGRSWRAAPVAGRSSTAARNASGRQSRRRWKNSAWRQVATGSRIAFGF